MIALDTNVISALMLSTPDRKVVSWLDQQAAESIWTTSINVFEILSGLETMAKGKRQRDLLDAFEGLIGEELGGRILDFDKLAAREAAKIAARLRAAGCPVEIRDVEIAGIVSARPWKFGNSQYQAFYWYGHQTG